MTSATIVPSWKLWYWVCSTIKALDHSEPTLNMRSHPSQGNGSHMQVEVLQAEVCLHDIGLCGRTRTSHLKLKLEAKDFLCLCVPGAQRISMIGHSVWRWKHRDSQGYGQSVYEDAAALWVTNLLIWDPWELFQNHRWCLLQNSYSQDWPAWDFGICIFFKVQ